MVIINKVRPHRKTNIYVYHFLDRVTGTGGATSDVQKELNQQMEQISEQHQKQLTTLRDEIHSKETQMETLKEYVFDV